MSTPTPREKRGGMLFLGLIIGLLAASVGFMSYTLYRATSDPTFAIEPDYYKKAMNWDQTQRQQAASDALGWAATFAVVKAPGAQTVTRIRLADRDGAPVSGAVLEAVCVPTTGARFSSRKGSPGCTSRPSRILCPGVGNSGSAPSGAIPSSSPPRN